MEAVKNTWFKRAAYLCDGKGYGILGIRGYSFDPIGTVEPITGISYNVDSMDGYIMCVNEVAVSAFVRFNS